MKSKKVNPHNVRRVINRRNESESPLMAYDLRELGVEIVIELNAHPSCTKTAVQVIELLLNSGDYVHVDGALRERLAGEPETPTKRVQRARSEQTRHQRHQQRIAAEQTRSQRRQQHASMIAESTVLAVA